MAPRAVRRARLAARPGPGRAPRPARRRLARRTAPAAFRAGGVGGAVTTEAPGGGQPARRNAALLGRAQLWRRLQPRRAAARLRFRRGRQVAWREEHAGLRAGVPPRVPGCVRPLARPPAAGRRVAVRRRAAVGRVAIRVRVAAGVAAQDGRRGARRRRRRRRARGRRVPAGAARPELGAGGAAAGAYIAGREGRARAVRGRRVRAASARRVRRRRVRICTRDFVHVSRCRRDAAALAGGAAAPARAGPTAARRAVARGTGRRSGAHAPRRARLGRPRAGRRVAGASACRAGGRRARGGCAAAPRRAAAGGPAGRHRRHRRAAVRSAVRGT